VADLPSGTVTFLFTDIEGSTRLWEECTEAMRLALAQHDALLEACIATHGGRVFKKGGDGFCAAFSTAADARRSGQEASRFRTQKAASLLANLAFHASPQSRETLIELLWPETEPETGRHNLSNALSFLRRVLEPPGVPPGSVLLVDRASARLNPTAVSIDATAFERTLRQAAAPGWRPSTRPPTCRSPVRPSWSTRRERRWRASARRDRCAICGSRWDGTSAPQWKSSPA
jgi:hypothetical protein